MKGVAPKHLSFFCILHLTGRVEKQQKGYLKKENNVPDESKDNGGISVGNISRIDADQLNLKEGTCMNVLSQAQAGWRPHAAHAATHVSLLQKRQHLGDVVQSENTVRRLLESMKLKIIQNEKNRTDYFKKCQTRVDFDLQH